MQKTLDFHQLAVSVGPYAFKGIFKALFDQKAVHGNIHKMVPLLARIYVEIGGWLKSACRFDNHTPKALVVTKILTPGKIPSIDGTALEQRDQETCPVPTPENRHGDRNERARIR